MHWSCSAIYAWKRRSQKGIRGASHNPRPALALGATNTDMPLCWSKHYRASSTHVDTSIYLMAASPVYLEQMAGKNGKPIGRLHFFPVTQVSWAQQPKKGTGFLINDHFQHRLCVSPEHTRLARVNFRRSSIGG
eukprot:1161576-Pelagomonas_calceolata.AAC.8